MFVLTGVEETANWTTGRILAIRDLFDQTLARCHVKLPAKVYSKELVEQVFTQPYCKIQFLVDAGITQRQTAAEYLQELENLGILKGEKQGREMIYKHPALLKGIRSEWREYLEDIAYQAAVLLSAYPEATIRCFMLARDKAKTARLEGLGQRFRIRRRGHAVDVEVVGDSSELLREDILTLFAADTEVNALAAKVDAATKQFKTGVLPALKKLPAEIGYDCRHCEPRLEDGVEKRGFAQGWGPLAR